MKLLLNMILGLGISAGLFLLLLFGLEGDLGPFIMIALLIGGILGMQVTIYHIMKKLK
ncbi:hypothetical protein [Peribacillus sp. SI8-4]|uniref:hypothetical protein n=1 Tax=Peribacillus sp. SI8-4 TaxID=3048009 RepID=UPI0025576BBC|nr:hypothetical protein [Peribacillus sp. SI8-4]